MNNVAVAFVVIGVVTPVTAVSFGIASAPILQPTSAFFAAFWLCNAISIHWIARRVLRSLRP